MCHSWLLMPLILQLSWLILVSAETYYATPTCPEGSGSCMTLSQFATQPNNYFTSNTTLILLPGNHSLDSELEITNITHLTISASLSGTTAIITCSQSIGFRFKEVSHVKISGITFMDCTNSTFSLVDQLVVDNCGFNDQGLTLQAITNAGILNSQFSSHIDGQYYLNNIRSSRIVIKNSKVLIAHCIFSGNIDNDTDVQSIGSVMYVLESKISVIDCTFINNAVSGHCVTMYIEGSTFSNVTIGNSSFINNTAYGNYGGAVCVNGSGDVVIDNSTFINNAINGDHGGAVYIASVLYSVTIRMTTFTNNTAAVGGGAVWVEGCHDVTIDNITFTNNTVRGLGRGEYEGGGALYVGYSTNVVLQRSKFTSNRANNSSGGGAYIQGLFKDLNITDTTFIRNSATKGAALYLKTCDAIFSDGYLIIDSNVGGTGVVYAVLSAVFFTGITTVSNNVGSVLTFGGNLTLSGKTVFMNNSFYQSGIQEGGAITSFQSNLHFHDTVNMLHNEAENGGAISAIESKVYMYGIIGIADNRALQSGGGIYAFRTDLEIEQSVVIIQNTADKKGGGIYAISSTINVMKRLRLIGNRAEKGGGVCLELSAKLYIVKTFGEVCVRINGRYGCFPPPNLWPSVLFTNNSAIYGGAVYVNDDTDSGICSTIHSATSECFLQVLALYPTSEYTAPYLRLINLFFFNNTASVAGGTLFGGLLDRCTVSPFAEVFQKFYDQSPNLVNGTSYLLNVTNQLTFSDISSNPVHICFCKDNQPDCSYQPPTKHVLKGSLFTVSLVAVDQVNNTVPNSIIHSSLFSGHGRLSEGQAIQQTINNESCTELQYNLFSSSQNENDTLLLYAEGPCNDTGISKSYIHIAFKQCPIGFQLTQDGDCSCDGALFPYITTNCFIDNQTVLRIGEFWITYTDGVDSDVKGFIIKPHCPFDYCHSPSEQVYINFNIPYGADVQCAFNRIGILCGSCGENLSLTLGSSLCMSCSNNWLALLILFAIAGIALVAFLLVFNLTVATGSINGLIFYANIIAANRAIFLPLNKVNFLTVFIAWLNLDFGFKTCLYDGMDGYAKVWLQLVFPCYIMLLVVIVIFVSEHSRRFTKLISYTNPVATLATLILLSYAKLLRTIIAALSFTTLEYPDGSHTTVWLYDANIPYLEGKHIGLFVVALFVFLAGLVYTFLLVFWQFILWFLNEQRVGWIVKKNSTVYRWYVGLQHFMDMYHAPYNTRHRYWTGLLLLLRGVLYLISAVNVFGDPGIILLSIVCVVTLLFIWKLVARRIYKTEYLSNIDTLFLANLVIFTATTLYIREGGRGNQAALAHTSVGIAFATFLGIIFYSTKQKIQHFYTLFKKKIQQKYLHIRKQLPLKEAAENSPLERHMYKELAPLSPTCSVTSFDGLPDPNQDMNSKPEAMKDCED